MQKSQGENCREVSRTLVSKMILRLRMGFSGRFSNAAARADGRARGRAGGRRGTRRASACAPRAPACREHLQPAAPLCGVWAPWRLTAARTRLISHKTARRGAILCAKFGVFLRFLLLSPLLFVRFTFFVCRQTNLPERGSAIWRPEIPGASANLHRVVT
jgi:hypothetical protein